jgi:ribonuclease HII
MICGVDEAGKGPVLGPLVVAGVSCRSMDDFQEIPVKDSKLLSRRQREELYDEIVDRFPCAVIVIDARKIDRIRTRMTLNRCVAEAHAAVIDQLRPATAYVDACDVNAPRYAAMVGEHLVTPCRIVSEHSADRTYPVVSAASIVAKVRRDRAIDELKREYGEIGSGYPSDPETILYLEQYIARHRRPPACARASWRTVGNLIADAEQQPLVSDNE